MEKREVRLIIVTGRKRIGKSNETLRHLFMDYLTQGRKFIIFDTNNEYGKYEIYMPDGSIKIFPIKKIRHRDIISFCQQTKIEPVRVIPVNDNGTPMTPEEIEKSLLYILRTFRGGALLIEDLNNIIGDSLPVAVSGALVNNAHRDCDVFVHMQSVGRILPKMVQNIDIVRLHFQFDGMENSAEKLKSEYEIYQIAQNIVNKQYKAALPTKGPGMRAFVFIDRLEQRLRGAFSQRMLYDAIEEYLHNDGSRVRRMLKRTDPSTGRKLYTYDQAVKAIGMKLVHEYYGN